MPRARGGVVVTGDGQEYIGHHFTIDNEGEVRELLERVESNYERIDNTLQEVINDLNEVDVTGTDDTEVLTEENLDNLIEEVRNASYNPSLASDELVRAFQERAMEYERRTREVFRNGFNQCGYVDDEPLVYHRSSRCNDRTLELMAEEYDINLDI